MRQMKAALRIAGGFILLRKRWIFFYIPLACVAFVVVYTAVIYANWRSDRDAAMQKLSKYKLLIDRTEEIRSGVAISSADADLKVKVVDIPTRIYDRNGEVIGEFFV